MMDVIHEWITGIVVVSVMCACAIALTANTPARQVVRMISAIALLFAAIWPLRQISAERLSRELSQYTVSYEQAEAVAASGNQELTKGLAEEQLSAYVERQTEALGIVCRAEVTVALSEDGVLLPSECRIITRSSLPQAQRTAVASLIVRELGISEEGQAYMVDE